MSILKYLCPLAEAEARFDPLGQLFMITLKDTFYQKCVHHMTFQIIDCELVHH